MADSKRSRRGPVKPLMTNRTGDTGRSAIVTGKADKPAARRATAASAARIASADAPHTGVHFIDGLIGSLDSVVHGVVTGWACVRNDTKRRLAIMVYVDDRHAMTVAAGSFRPDLLAAGVGDGYHGFSAALPDVLLDDMEHRVRCVVEGSGQVVGHGDGLFLLTPPPPTPALWGSFDSVWEGVVDGWVWSPADPLRRRRVRVQIDGKVAGEAVASFFRADLAESEMSDGHCAFAIPLPHYLLDGKLHRIEVIDIETGTSLPAQSPTFRLLQKNEKAISVRHDDFYQLFDVDYYLKQTGPLSNPLEHYITEGWKRNYNPHPLFDTGFYLLRYGEKFDGDPLTHFFSFGQHLKHETHPLFDVQLYLKRRPDVLANGLHPLFHYLRDGTYEMTAPSRFFDEDFYNSENPGLREGGFIPLIHYLVFGWAEGRSPSPEFQPHLFARLAGVPPGIEPLGYFAGAVLTHQQPAVPPRETDPVITVIIINLGKSLLTLQCIHILKENSKDFDIEIIVIDNGSSAEQFSLLCQHAGAHRIIRLDSNRGFGEANNIGADFARGRYLLFLNNDAFVLPGWLAALMAAIEGNPSVGAVGPKFLFPDGRLQEAGAMMAACGTALQRGKYMDGSFNLFDRAGPTKVDYCSAATLLVRTDSFRRVLGYDLCWDPAYYEDPDLCLKLRLIGQSTLYVPDASVIHIENATASDKRINLQLHDIVAINRFKFVSRWSEYLSGASNGAEERRLLPTVPTSARRDVRGTLGLYTPFPLTPGGGERYLLTIAAALRDRFDCTLLTPDRVSRLRLLTMARELELELDHVELSTFRDAQGSRSFDVFVAMGNEVLPPVPGLGSVNIFHCQFPFPLENEHFVNNWKNFQYYHAAMVNTKFTNWYFSDAIAQLGLGSMTSYVVNPPVPQVSASVNVVDKGAGPLLLLNVGRFFPGGHCKRQDVMIETFSALVKTSTRPLELHLVGALGSDPPARQYLTKLQIAARGLPVTFHVNIMPNQIQDLYRRASIYWHATGINDDIGLNPERFEHFGITIAEAMSAGAVPVVLRHGGPSEIITDTWNGFLVDDSRSLLETTARVIEMSSEDLAEIAGRAIERAQSFAPGRFKERLLSVLLSESAKLGLEKAPIA